MYGFIRLVSSFDFLQLCLTVIIVQVMNFFNRFYIVLKIISYMRKQKNVFNLSDLVPTLHPTTYGNKIIINRRYYGSELKTNSSFSCFLFSLFGKKFIYNTNLTFFSSILYIIKIPFEKALTNKIIFKIFLS
jgi:hypothetical protein